MIVISAQSFFVSAEGRPLGEKGARLTPQVVAC